MHERLLAEHGGPSGLLNEQSLDAALASPKNHFAYERADVFRLVAAYAYALTRNHPFHNGNKRIALTAAGVFLELNGFRLDAPESAAAAATRALSTRQISETSFAAWLKESSSKIASPRKGRSRPSTKRPGPRASTRRRPPASC